MTRSIASIALFSICLVVTPATAKINVQTLPTPPSRSVTALATGAPGAFDSTSAGGIYTHTASTSGSTMAGLVSADAYQSSAIPDLFGPAMAGIGTSAVAADATGLTGFSALADSFFDVFFDVNVDQTYRLEADVKWLGDFPPWSGYARVQLSDVTNSTVPFDVQRDSMLPGMAHLDMLVPLYVGVTYRLRGESHIAGGFATAGVYDAGAGWSFVLRVPEPTTAWLGMCAAIAMFGCFWRRR